MTRDEKLELIWSRTPADHRGIAGDANPDARPIEHHGKRTIVVNRGDAETIPKLLEGLTDQEIEDMLPIAFRKQRHADAE